MINDATDILLRAQAEYRRALRTADSKLAAAVAQSPAYLQEALALQARYDSVGYEPQKLGAYLQPVTVIAPASQPVAYAKTVAKLPKLEGSEAVLNRKQQKALDATVKTEGKADKIDQPTWDLPKNWGLPDVGDGGEPVK
jgi:hypothetical protein